MYRYNRNQFAGRGAAVTTILDHGSRSDVRINSRKVGSNTMTSKED